MYYNRPMATIPVRDLNQRTAQVLEEITASGRTAQVTKNGIVRWHIMPVPAQPASRLDALIRAGLATRPEATLPLPSGPRPVPSGRDVAELLDELDGEDR
jgi:antitoxin (DNA-binding transcriptional repressor) of toxin-antitoxin stability system